MCHLPLLLLLVLHPLESLASRQTTSRPKEYQDFLRKKAQLGTVSQEYRQPRFEDITHTTVLDFSKDNDQLSDDNGEYTGATLLMDASKSLPASFTICTSYLTEAWTEYTMAYMWQLLGKDGVRWGKCILYAGPSYTEYTVSLGNVFFEQIIDKVWFPMHWTHICVSLDYDTGKITLVVDGQVLHEKVYQEARQEDETRPSSLDLTLGRHNDSFGYVVQTPGQITNLNVFSSALSRERMRKMTGGNECEAPGDYLSWEKEEWSLHSKARVKMVDSQEPCRKESKIQVFLDFNWHQDCMAHCAKIGGGRSPPVRTLQELELFQAELHAVTADISVLPWLWLAAVDKEKEGEWTQVA